MQTDEQIFEELVRSMYERAEATPWELAPQEIRAQRRHRVMTFPDPKVIALIAAAVVLVAFGFFFLRPTAHRSTSSAASTTTTSISRRSVAVPNVVGLAQAQAAMTLGDAGLGVGTITLASSTTFAAGAVIGTNPSAGTTLAAGTAVSLTVSAGPSGSTGSAGTTVPSTTPVIQQVPSGQATSSTPISPTDCPSGNRSITVTTSSAAACVRTGVKLTVTFDSQGWWSGYGSWSTAAPMISNGSVLEGLSYVPSGKTAIAVFNAYAPGSSVVTAQFNVSCAPADTTPCTVPPEAFEILNVTVAGG